MLYGNYERFKYLGPNYLIFYKEKNKPVLLFVNFYHPNSFNMFSLLVILKAPVHNELAFLCSLSSCSLSYMVQESKTTSQLSCFCIAYQCNFLVGYVVIIA